MRHMKTHRHYALKVISAETHAKYPSLFDQEVKMLTACKNCENIVHVKESFVADDEHCIVMEYLPEGDLDQQLAARGY